MDLPTIDDAAAKARERAQNARNQVQSRLSILPDKETCERCGGVLEQSTEHDPIEGAFFERYAGGDRPTWYCEDCDTHFRRDDDGPTFDVWD